MNLKKYYLTSLALLLVFLAASLAGCDKEGETIDIGYMQLSTEIIYKADADHKYTFLYKGLPVSSTYYNRADTIGEFIAMNGDAEELHTTLHVKPGDTIRFVQFTGQPIQFLDSLGGDNDVQAPQSKEYTKVRFLFETNVTTADNLRIILRKGDKKGTPFDTLDFHKSEISPYSTDLSLEDQKASPYLYNLYDMTNPAKPKTLWTKAKIEFATNGAYKFGTYKVDSYKNITFLFGETWSE